jgi:DNA-binding NarL/FixJ family response regulator
VRLALAPDAPLVVAGTCALLASAAPEIDVVRLTDAGDDPGRVEMLLYDPQRHRVAHFDRLRGSSPRVLVVAYSWSTRPDIVDEARRDGAVAFLSKELDEEEVATAIRAVRAGHRSRFLVQPYVAAPTRQARPGGLTERECDVIELVTQGHSNDEIARRLFLSVNSVKSYIRTAYRKIGATRRSQAVLWGVEHGFNQGQGEVRSPQS